MHFPQKTENIFWDQKDSNLFAVQEGDSVYTFIINKNNINGTLIQPVRELLSIEEISSSEGSKVVTTLDRGSKPLSLGNGFLKSFTPTG